MISIYKSGLILAPGELVSWTKRIKKLTSTRHKNVLLRVAHGDVFSNERLHRFGLRDNAGCANCNDNSETPMHIVLSCPKALRTWELLDELRARLGLNRLTDHSFENILGAKDKLTKVELALQAEVLLRIISSQESYNPESLIKASTKVIYHSERLSRDLKNIFTNELSG